MNSLHDNSPEDNYQNLQASEAAQKIKELAEASKFCFFCTARATGDSDGVRPMGFAKIEDDGTLWFVSATDSHKNAEIATDPRVKLYIHGDADTDFLYLAGTATITTDKATTDDLWTPMMKVWFDEGKDDPRLSAIRFTPDAGYYWTTKHGKAGYLLKSVASLVTGKTMDDSMQGKIDA